MCLTCGVNPFLLRAGFIQGLFAPCFGFIGVMRRLFVRALMADAKGLPDDAMGHVPCAMCHVPLPMVAVHTTALAVLSFSWPVFMGLAAGNYVFYRVTHQKSHFHKTHR